MSWEREFWEIHGISNTVLLGLIHIFMCNIYLVDISDFIYSHFFNVTRVYLLIKEEMYSEKNMVHV